MRSNGLKLTVPLFLCLFLVIFGISTSLYGYSHKNITISANATGIRPTQQSVITYQTKGGYIAATSERLLNRLVVLALSGNQNAFRKFVKANPDVFPLKAGLKVLIEQKSWPGKVKIRPYNTEIRVWTVQEAIE